MADDNETEFDFLSNIKLILGISNDNDDKFLLMYISVVQSEILNYCNIRELPSALNYTLCTMVADLYRDNKKNNSNKEIVGNVSSVSEDGRSVSFSNGTEFLTDVQNRITKLTELNRFKKLYKI